MDALSRGDWQTRLGWESDSKIEKETRAALRHLKPQEVSFKIFVMRLEAFVKLDYDVVYQAQILDDLKKFNKKNSGFFGKAHLDPEARQLVNDFLDRAIQKVKENQGNGFVTEDTCNEFITEVIISGFLQTGTSIDLSKALTELMSFDFNSTCAVNRERYLPNLCILSLNQRVNPDRIVDFVKRCITNKFVEDPIAFLRTVYSKQALPEDLHEDLRRSFESLDESKQKKVLNELIRAHDDGFFSILGKTLDPKSYAVIVYEAVMMCHESDPYAKDWVKSQTDRMFTVLVSADQTNDFSVMNSMLSGLVLGVVDPTFEKKLRASGYSQEVFFMYHIYVNRVSPDRLPKQGFNAQDCNNYMNKRGLAIFQTFKECPNTEQFVKLRRLYEKLFSKYVQRDPKIDQSYIDGLIVLLKEAVLHELWPKEKRFLSDAKNYIVLHAKKNQLKQISELEKQFNDFIDHVGRRPKTEEKKPSLRDIIIEEELKASRQTRETGSTTTETDSIRTNSSGSKRTTSTASSRTASPASIRTTDTDSKRSSYGLFKILKRPSAAEAIVSDLALDLLTQRVDAGALARSQKVLNELAWQLKQVQIADLPKLNEEFQAQNLTNNYKEILSMAKMRHFGITRLKYAVYRCLALLKRRYEKSQALLLIYTNAHEIIAIQNPRFPTLRHNKITISSQRTTTYRGLLLPPTVRPDLRMATQLSNFLPESTGMFDWKPRVMQIVPKFLKSRQDSPAQNGVSLEVAINIMNGLFDQDTPAAFKLALQHAIAFSAARIERAKETSESSSSEHPALLIFYWIFEYTHQYQDITNPIDVGIMAELQKASDLVMQLPITFEVLVMQFLMLERMCLQGKSTDFATIRFLEIFGRPELLTLDLDPALVLRVRNLLMLIDIKKAAPQLHQMLSGGQTPPLLKEAIKSFVALQYSLRNEMGNQTDSVMLLAGMMARHIDFFIIYKDLKCEKLFGEILECYMKTFAVEPLPPNSCCSIINGIFQQSQIFSVILDSRILQSGVVKIHLSWLKHDPQAPIALDILNTLVRRCLPAPEDIKNWLEILLLHGRALCSQATFATVEHVRSTQKWIGYLKALVEKYPDKSQEMHIKNSIMKQIINLAETQMVIQEWMTVSRAHVQDPSKAWEFAKQHYAQNFAMTTDTNLQTYDIMLADLHERLVVHADIVQTVKLLQSVRDVIMVMQPLDVSQKEQDRRLLANLMIYADLFALIQFLDEKLGIKKSKEQKLISGLLSLIYAPIVKDFRKKYKGKLDNGVIEVLGMRLHANWLNQNTYSAQDTKKMIKDHLDALPKETLEVKRDQNEDELGDVKAETVKPKKRKKKK